MLTRERVDRPRSATPTVHRCGCRRGGEQSCACQVNRLADRAGVVTPQVPGSVVDVVRERGRAMDDLTRRQMQARLGHDFGSVRIHSDDRAAASARAVDAVAYTVGEHIVLDQHRMPAVPTEKASVLAHELMHTVQQGKLGGRRLPDRVSHPDDAAETEAHRLAGSSERAAPARPTGVQRQPVSGPQTVAGVSLTVRQDGRLDVVATGPKLPAVGQPAAGLRRNADGTYTVTFGADDKVVAPAEVPAMLRGVIAGATKGEVAQRSFRIPSCSGLRNVADTRWKTFDEYRATQMLNPELMPLTPLFYQYLVNTCGSGDRGPAAAEPADAAPAPQEAIPPVMPEGQAVA